MKETRNFIMSSLIGILAVIAIEIILFIIFFAIFKSHAGETEEKLNVAIQRLNEIEERLDQPLNLYVK